MKTAFALPKIVLILFSCLFMASCISNKRIVYLQEKNKEITYSDTFKYDRSQYKLQINDIINVDVVTRNSEFSKLFSTGTTGNQNIAAMGGGGGGGDLYYAIGYPINDSGQVIFPLIGAVKVAGLTILQTKEKLQKELSVYESDIQVFVRIGGLRFSLLGEFNRPGKMVALQNQLTIFEAIALGGDLTEMARREKIILLRQYPDGARIHYIDVLDKNIVNSPFYFLQPNDLLYAEPLKRRAYGIGTTGLETFSTALALVTTTLLLINYFNR